MSSVSDCLPPELQFSAMVTRKGRGYGIAVGMERSVDLSSLVDHLEEITATLKLRPDYKPLGN